MRNIGFSVLHGLVLVSFMVVLATADDKHGCPHDVQTNVTDPPRYMTIPRPAHAFGFVVPRNTTCQEVARYYEVEYDVIINLNECLCHQENNTVFENTEVLVPINKSPPSVKYPPGKPEILKFGNPVHTTNKTSCYEFAQTHSMDINLLTYQHHECYNPNATIPINQKFWTKGVAHRTDILDCEYPYHINGNMSCEDVAKEKNKEGVTSDELKQFNPEVCSNPADKPREQIICLKWKTSTPANDCSGKNLTYVAADKNITCQQLATAARVNYNGLVELHSECKDSTFNLLKDSHKCIPKPFGFCGRYEKNTNTHYQNWEIWASGFGQTLKGLAELNQNIHDFNSDTSKDFPQKSITDLELCTSYSKGCPKSYYVPHNTTCNDIHNKCGACLTAIEKLNPGKCKDGNTTLSLGDTLNF